MSVITLPRPPTTEEVRQVLSRVLGPRMADYELHQIHGQRKLFNPMLINVHTPPEGCEVFVGRLPRDLYEDELVPPFLEMGPIFEMRTMMNFSGTNRGFAFVCFFTRAAAVRAVNLLNNFEIRPGQLIGVLPSVNNRRLYIGGLMDIPNLKSLLFHWMCQETEGMENITLYPFAPRKSKPGEPMAYRCAIVSYTSHRAAAMARRKLIPLKHLLGLQVVIDWADPRMQARKSGLLSALKL